MRRNAKILLLESMGDKAQYDKVKCKAYMDEPFSVLP